MKKILHGDFSFIALNARTVSRSVAVLLFESIDFATRPPGYDSAVRDGARMREGQVPG